MRPVESIIANSITKKSNGILKSMNLSCAFPNNELLLFSKMMDKLNGRY